MVCQHRRRLWSASTVRRRPCALPCGPLTRQLAGTSRCASFTRSTPTTARVWTARTPLARSPPPSAPFGRVIAAVEATDKPVKIEVEITKGPPVGTLVRASRSAAMVCVGAVGSDHFQPDRVGSTAAAVATSAQCPVAVIHGFGRPTRPHPGWVVVEADKSPDNGVVLGAAVDEARLRNAPLRVITCWQAPSGDQQAVAEGDHRIHARLTRRLSPWRRRYPDLRIEPIAVHGSILDYLAKSAADVQLLVVGARDAQHLARACRPGRQRRAA